MAPIVTLGIDVREVGGEITHAADEAAMAYAYGRIDEAVQILRGAIKVSPADPRCWRMLFDLFRYADQRDAFEELAVNYAMTLERSPPNWEPAPNAESAVAARSGYLVLDPRLTAQNVAACREQCVDASPARLDFSRVREIGADACAPLIALLTDLRKRRIRIEHAGTDALCESLQQVVAHLGAEAKQHWLLLLAMLQLADRPQEFEDLAIEYAIRFEESPPSWEPGPENVPVSPMRMNKTQYSLSGNVSAANGEQIKGLQTFATTHDPVELDLSTVARIDMAVIPLLMTTLVTVMHMGKRVVVRGPNEMVRVLFVLMGLHEFVDLPEPPPL